tara:strand:- start:1723 stop:2550 length:828 start_codon:yes stop_codon:yes gene_type:complete
MENNPLQKYYRQPKIYLDLPSKGNFYPKGALEGDPSKLPVFGMTAMDEIMFKTPDALFNGEATVQVIKSCIPNILHPWAMPQLDVDACLIAIRIATYGELLETTFACSSCGEDNKFDLDLTKSLEYYLSLEYDASILIGPMMVTVRPLTYKEATEINTKSFEFRRQLYNVSGLEDEEIKNNTLNDIYKKIADLSAKGFTTAIAKIEVEDSVVDDPGYIQDWLKNSDKEFFDSIRTHLEKNNEKWSLKSQSVSCVECSKENKVAFGLDNSDFFVKR